MLVGQAKFLKENINAYIAYAFIGAYALGIGLIIWHATLGGNPIANALAKDVQLSSAQQGAAK